MTCGKGTAVTCVSVPGVGVLSSIETVVRHSESNGSRSKIITPAPDVADFESKSSSAKHVVKVADGEVGLSRGIGGFCYEPL